VRSLSLLVLLLGAPAFAHQVGISRSSWKAEPGRVTGVLTFANSELNALNAQALEKAVAHSVVVPGCSRSDNSARAVEADGVEVTLVFTCAEPGEEVDFAPLFERLGADHRHLVETANGEVVLTAHQPRFAFEGSKSRSTLDIVVMGVEHILKGADHLLFLLGLLLGVRRLRDIVLVATAFTLGHSISLTVATLGLVVPPSRIVEPLIALSLIWVGVENIYRGEAKGRWRIAALFGLVHGFGFASALRELGLPREQLGWALLGFNAGVEVGQLLVLLPLVPLLALLRKKERLEKLGARVLSSGVALAGLVWFVARVGGFALPG
jgi:hydrogenase/urease accessory protein HupE